jgi:hypothetical protein
MKVSILHPSRSRPELAKKVYDEWMGKAANPDDIEYLVSIDTTYKVRHLYSEAFLGEVAPFAPHLKLWQKDNILLSIDHNNSAIEAINNAAKIATGDLLIVVSDDFSCPQNWDMDLLKRLDGKEDFVVKTSDGGGQPWIMTLPIMDRKYYNRFGYIYHPSYVHLFADTEMTHVGDLLDRTIIVPMVFKHNHYSQKGGIPKDQISVKNDATWNQGEALYLERLKRNFDLPESEIKGVLRCDQSHYNWLKSKGIKMEVV